MKHLENNCTETSKWNITCHYSEEKESTNFIECMALFLLEKEQGWDSDFRPVAEHMLKKGDDIV